MGTFPFFDAWLNVVQLPSIVSPFPFHQGLSSFPNGKVVVSMRQSCHGHPWHIFCLFCCLVCLFIFFTSYVCREFTQSDLFSLVIELCQYVIYLIKYWMVFESLILLFLLLLFQLCGWRLLLVVPLYLVLILTVQCIYCFNVLLFCLYRNLSLSSFFLSFRGRSFASTCRNSTGDVLEAPVYIFMPSL